MDGRTWSLCTTLSPNQVWCCPSPYPTYPQHLPLPHVSRGLINLPSLEFVLRSVEPKRCAYVLFYRFFLFLNFHVCFGHMSCSQYPHMMALGPPTNIPPTAGVHVCCFAFARRTGIRIEAGQHPYRWATPNSVMLWLPRFRVSSWSFSSFLFRSWGTPTIISASIKNHTRPRFQTTVVCSLFTRISLDFFLNWIVFVPDITGGWTTPYLVPSYYDMNDVWLATGTCGTCMRGRKVHLLGYIFLRLLCELLSYDVILSDKTQRVCCVLQYTRTDCCCTSSILYQYDSTYR